MNEVIRQQPVVGLFGTCGNSTFRQDTLIPRLQQAGAVVYNPQVAAGTWKPEMAQLEAQHLRHDMVQTWPVTGETYGCGSLGELGFSIASSMRSTSPLPKFVIPMITAQLDEALDDPVARQESLRARALAIEHLRHVDSTNVVPVGSLDEMAEVAGKLYHVAQGILQTAVKYNPAIRQYMTED